MLALHPEWIGMGQLHENNGYNHRDLSYLDLCGTAGVSVFYLELKRGLDVLLAQKFADPERVAMTGLSGGGWQDDLLQLAGHEDQTGRAKRRLHWARLRGSETWMADVGDHRAEHD